MENTNPLSASTAVITVEGNYQGKNLYVQNPFSSNGVGFCVYEVRVNGQTTTDEIGSSAFEIDFHFFNLKVGDAVQVQIFHKEGCNPKVLNPEVLRPRSSFVITSIQADSVKGTLSWVTSNEKGKLPYTVESYRWNRWNNEGEVPGTGTDGPNTYSFQPSFCSGANRFRVKQVDYTGQPKLSPEANCTSTKPKVTFVNDPAQKRIRFSAETAWLIYDQYGTILKRGKSDSIDTSTLKKGGYFLYYDNDAGEFVIK